MVIDLLLFHLLRAIKHCTVFPPKHPCNSKFRTFPILLLFGFSTVEKSLCTWHTILWHFPRSKKHNYSICICRYHFYQFGALLKLHFQSRSLTFFESYRITMLNIRKWSNEEAICCFAFTNNTIERCGVVFCRCAFMIRWNTTDGNHDKDLLSIVRYRCCPAIEGRYCCEERVWVTIGTTIRKVK